MADVYLGIGSNIGKREANIHAAIELLRRNPHFVIVAISHPQETDPVGPPQRDYINACAQVSTDLSPMELLEELHRVENALGRERTIKWGPRTIDLDILFYDDLIMDNDKLTIPHPLVSERLFVLEPLVEIAPDFVNPANGLTVLQMYQDLKSEQQKP